MVSVRQTWLSYSKKHSPKSQWLKIIGLFLAHIRFIMKVHHGPLSRNQAIGVAAIWNIAMCPRQRAKRAQYSMPWLLVLLLRFSEASLRLRGKEVKSYHVSGRRGRTIYLWITLIAITYTNPLIFFCPCICVRYCGEELVYQGGRAETTAIHPGKEEYSVTDIV